MMAPAVSVPQAAAILMLMLVLLLIAPVGIWIGMKLDRRIDPVLFYRLLYLGMFLTGVKLVWDALL